MQNINKNTTPTFPPAAGVTPSSEMTSTDMNNILGKHAERTDYLYSLGIYPHDSAYNYPVGAFCQSGGTVYKAKTANTNKTPAANANDWDKCAMTLSELQLLLGLGSALAVSIPNLQNQKHTSAITSGSAPAYVATLNTAPTLVTDLTFLLTVHAGNNGVAATLNINGLGPIQIKQYNSGGVKSVPNLFANQRAFVTYDGTDFVILDSIVQPKLIKTVNAAATAVLEGTDTTIISYTVVDAGWVDVYGYSGFTVGGSGLTKFDPCIKLNGSLVGFTGSMLMPSPVQFRLSAYALGLLVKPGDTLTFQVSKSGGITAASSGSEIWIITRG